MHYGIAREISPNSGILLQANFFCGHRTSKCLAVDVRYLVINVLSLSFLGLLSTQCDTAQGISVDTAAVIYLLLFLYLESPSILSYDFFGNV